MMKYESELSRCYEGSKTLREIGYCGREPLSLLGGVPVGIEVELEGITRRPPEFKMWRVTEDGSLRDNGKEFVSCPLREATVPVALNELCSWLKAATYRVSGRCSVHVHVQASHLTESQFIKTMILYSIVERFVFQFASQERFKYKNKFCVSYEDMNFIRLLSHDVLKRSVPSWGGDGKYAALNTSRLRDLGTIEFRMREGTGNYHRIYEWYVILRGLIYAAGKLTLDDMLTLPADVLLERVFPEYCADIIVKASYAEDKDFLEWVQIRYKIELAEAFAKRLAEVEKAAKRRPIPPRPTRVVIDEAAQAPLLWALNQNGDPVTLDASLFNTLWVPNEVAFPADDPIRVPDSNF